jgi:hypothetical protein
VDGAGYGGPAEERAPVEREACFALHGGESVSVRVCVCGLRVVGERK